MKKTVRKMALTLLRTFNPGKIKIKHHYTGTPVRLDAYQHKGYWWHGKRREQTTMQQFASRITPGQHVVEVGGHIGYISLYFSHLVGPEGKVTIFEPGPNNLPYLEENIAPAKNTTLVRKAVSSETGTVKFYIENLTGQNNSLNKNFEAFQNNRQNAFSDATYQEIEVQATTLDEYMKTCDRPVDFLKIDVEGAEMFVLTGARETLLRDRPQLMVEVAQEADNHKTVYEFLTTLGYELYTPEAKQLHSAEEVKGNTFCLPKELSAGLKSGAKAAA